MDGGACVRTVSGPASRKQDGGRGDERAAQKQELFFRFPTLPRARSSFLRVIATLPLATLFGLAERGRLCFDRIARVFREEGALFWIAGSLAGSVSGPLVLAPGTRAGEAVNSAAAAICGALALLRRSPRYLHRWPELAACGRGGRRGWATPRVPRPVGKPLCATGTPGSGPRTFALVAGCHTRRISLASCV